MPKYHLILADNAERDVFGDDIAIIDGALIIRNSNGEAVVAYSEGSWLLCEMERKDDRE